MTKHDLATSSTRSSTDEPLADVLDVSTQPYPQDITDHTAPSALPVFQQPTSPDSTTDTQDPDDTTGNVTGGMAQGATATDDAPANLLLGKYKKNLVTVEQLVDVPDVEWARNGSRKGASRSTTRLHDLEQVALDYDACALLADSIVDLPRIVELTRSDFLTQVRVAGLVLGQAVGRLLGGGTSVLTVVNPRGGHVSRTPVKPVAGCTDSNGRMLAQAERTIESFDVLRAAVLETVKNTLLLGGKYQESIIASGVMDPILLRPTRTTLVKENVSFTALESPDGTTRSITSLSVLFDTTDPDKLTDQILAAHFGPQVLTQGLPAQPGDDIVDISDEVRQNLRRAHRTLLNDYWAKVGDPDLGATHPDTLRLQQAMSIPATLTLSVDSNSPAPRSYVEALTVLVRNTHMNRENWTGAAEASDLALSVVSALMAQGLLDERDQDLLVASTPQACERALAAYEQGYNLGPDAASLWRAVKIMSIFTRPEVREAAKQPLREALSLVQIRQARYAEVIATLIDLPWRDAKSRSAKQAYNAWQRNGALVKEMWYGKMAWTPVFADPTTLVDDTSTDATLTLTALGGVALIADRFLTADAVAGVGDAGQVKMPYKVATIDKLIELLARPANTAGRQQLALAATVFRADGESDSPWRAGERQERETALKALRASNAKARAQGHHDRIVDEPVYYTTSAVTGESLNATQLMVIADHDGTLTAAHQGGTPKPNQPTPPKVLSPEEQIADAREQLLTSLSSVTNRLSELSALAFQHQRSALDASTRAEAIELAFAITGQLSAMPVAPVGEDVILVDDTDDQTDDQTDSELDVDGRDAADEQ